VHTRVDGADEEGTGENLIKIQYEIDGGSGMYVGATGTSRAEVRLEADRFHGAWVLTLGS
jgi:hypothetical protein